MHLVSLTVRHGLSIHSALAFVTYAAVLDRLSQYKDLWDFVYTSQECSKRFPDSVMPGATLFVKAAYADVNVLPPRKLSGQFEEAMLVGIENGDLLYSSWSSALLISYLFYVSIPHFLESVTQHAACIRTRNPAAHKLLTSEIQLGRTLNGLTRSLASFDEDAFSSVEFEAEFDRDRLGPAAGWYFVMRAICSWMNRDTEAAAGATIRSFDFEVLELASENRILSLYMGLSLLGQAAARGKRAVLHPGPFRKIMNRLHTVAKISPDIFAGLPVLLEAELVALRGDHGKAEVLYEDAIGRLRLSGYTSFWATALKCAGRYHAGRSLHTAATAYLTSACRVYRAWGAVPKALAIEAEFLRSTEVSDLPAATLHGATSRTTITTSKH